jgi:hypothetical protein
MTDPSPELHKAVREGQQKLTYFLLGLETAVFAYIGKDFVAQPIAFSRNTLELFGLLAFALAIIFGILALSAYLFVQKLNLEHLDLNRVIRELRTAAQSSTPHINFSSSEILNSEVLLAQSEVQMKEYQELSIYMASASRKTEIIGLIHTVFLMLGFLLFAVSRSIGLFP